jgi:hypothetical protein
VVRFLAIKLVVEVVKTLHLQHLQLLVAAAEVIRLMDGLTVQGVLAAVRAAADKIIGVGLLAVLHVLQDRVLRVKVMRAVH